MPKLDKMKPISTSGLSKMDKPESGNKLVITGKIEQCMAQSKEATMPKRSAFILLA